MKYTFNNFEEIDMKMNTIIIAAVFTAISTASMAGSFYDEKRGNYISWSGGKITVIGKDSGRKYNIKTETPTRKIKRPTAIVVDPKPAKIVMDGKRNKEGYIRSHDHQNWTVGEKYITPLGHRWTILPD